MENQNRSVVILGGGDISTSDFLSAEGGSSGSQRVTNNKAEHHGSKQCDSCVLFSDSEPSGDEGKKLPLPCVNPEHDQLWDAVVQVLAQVEAGFESWAEACWFHSDVLVLDDSHDEIGQEVGDESGDCKAFCSHLVDLNDLVADKWVHHTNSEEICEAWRPEFMEAVEESTICIANTPEPKGWAEVHKVLLGHVSILLILSKDVRKYESTVHGSDDHEEE